MSRPTLLLPLALIAAGPAQASIGCLVRPQSGETTTLRAAPFARAPAIAVLERGRVVSLDDFSARGWRRVHVAPLGEACCSDLTRTSAGWVRQADLDECG